MLKITSLLFMVFANFVSTAGAGDRESDINLRGNLPEALLQAAYNRDCKPIDNFYTYSDIQDPPYVYGFSKGDRYNSAAVLCQRNDGRFNIIFLVKKSDEPKYGNFKECASIVEVSQIMGGLHLDYKKIPLSRFYYLGNKKHKRGPANVQTSSPIILNIAEGTGAGYYCYRGKWLVTSFD